MRSPKNPKMATIDEQQPKIIKTSHSSSSSSKWVPVEIIIEILSRLPVESLLLRCKSVCKSWRSLISDPYFIKYHLALSTTNHHYAHHHLLACTYEPVKKFKTCSLYDVLCNSINSLEVHFPMKQPCNWISIVGSCNGLICMCIDEELYIWNPRTRKSIQLPDRPRFYGTMFHGFGYVESSDDYKVVEIMCPIKGRYDDIKKKDIVRICSSRNRNWKEINGFPHSCCTLVSDVSLKGSLHWIAREDSGMFIIVSLDLAKEIYGEVLLPAVLSKHDEVDVGLKLGIIGDCLCVLCDHKYNRHCADVWVMKVYGVKDSWFKLLSIPYDVVNFVEQFKPGYLFCLCVLDDGKVLLQFKSSLIVFDSKNRSALEIEKLDGCRKACTFVESLVSPSGHENLN